MVVIEIASRIVLDSITVPGDTTACAPMITLSFIITFFIISLFFIIILEITKLP